MWTAPQNPNKIPVWRSNPERFELPIARGRNSSPKTVSPTGNPLRTETTSHKCTSPFLYRESTGAGLDDYVPPTPGSQRPWSLDLLWSPSKHVDATRSKPKALNSTFSLGLLSGDLDETRCDAPISISKLRGAKLRRVPRPETQNSNSASLARWLDLSSGPVFAFASRLQARSFPAPGP